MRNRTENSAPRMYQAKSAVEREPGRYMLYYVRQVAPYGIGWQYGYRTMHRAAKAGLIRIEGERGRWRCYPVAEGK